MKVAVPLFGVCKEVDCMIELAEDLGGTLLQNQLLVVDFDNCN